MPVDLLPAVVARESAELPVLASVVREWVGLSVGRLGRLVRRKRESVGPREQVSAELRVLVGRPARPARPAAATYVPGAQWVAFDWGRADTE